MEAARVAGLPGVTAVRRERALRISTDAGPQWIGANQLWVGVNGVAATRGEGVVIGIIDTGINPTHPSFAASTGDGFTITNPRGHFYGLCTAGQAQCNSKLIGIYDFTTEGSKGVDTVGHGSHVSGIAAGNAISDSLQGYTVSLSRNVSGVAPHANLIMYKGCNAKPIDSTSDGTCAESALVAAIDQATADQVDVINYSIGGDAVDPYELLADHTSDAYAFFNARAAGVVISAAAGNEGPGASSISEPGNVPWVIGVGQRQPQSPLRSIRSRQFQRRGECAGNVDGAGLYVGLWPGEHRPTRATTVTHCAAPEIRRASHRPGPAIRSPPARFTAKS